MAYVCYKLSKSAKDAMAQSKSSAKGSAKQRVFNFVATKILHFKREDDDLLPLYWKFTDVYIMQLAIK